jgi:hypothetical protein
MPEKDVGVGEGALDGWRFMATSENRKRAQLIWRWKAKLN